MTGGRGSDGEASVDDGEDGVRVGVAAPRGVWIAMIHRGLDSRLRGNDGWGLTVADGEGDGGRETPSS